jgi:hypothetical protein
MKRQLWCALVLAMGCGGAAGVDATSATAPNIGKQDAQGADTADSSCNIVLRSVSDPSNGTGGWKEVCNSDGCWQIYDGQIDVNPTALKSGVSVHVLWEGQTRAWDDVAATDAGPSGAMERFNFELAKNTIEPGVSHPEGFTVSLVPFLKTPDGRVFDHNRNKSPLQNYELTGYGASISDDPSVCH